MPDLRFFMVWAALASSLAAAGLALAADIRIFRLLGAVGVVCWAVWPFAGLAMVLPRAGLVFWALVCVVAGHILAQRRSASSAADQDPITGTGRWLAGNLLALYCAYCLAAIGGNLLNFVREPRWALGIPAFIFVNPFFVVLEFILQSMAVLTWYCGLWGLQILAGVFCVAEIIRPGIVAALLRAVMERIAAVAQPAGTAGSRNPRNLVIFGVLLIILILMGVRRFQEGFLTGDAARIFGDIVLRLALPIVGLFLVLRKQVFFRRLRM